MSLTTTNKKIAATPFPTNQIQSSTSRGVAVIDQSMRLTPLVVLYPSVEGVAAGITIYVTGDCMKHKWAGEVYTHRDGTKFILVPLDMVVAFEPPELESMTSREEIELET